MFYIYLEERLLKSDDRPSPIWLYWINEICLRVSPDMCDDQASWLSRAGPLPNRQELRSSSGMKGRYVQPIGPYFHPPWDGFFFKEISASPHLRGKKDCSSDSRSNPWNFLFTHLFNCCGSI